MSIGIVAIKSIVLCVLSLVFLAQPVLACMWDLDTLQQERSRFPSAIELLTGKFLRHSREFYEWRIRDRQQRLVKEPRNLAYYDDLGVAYQKTGQDGKAIEVMRVKEKLSPASMKLLQI